MPLTTQGIIALVTGSSVLAAIVTQSVGWVRDRFKDKKDGSFSALYLAIALESYAGQCAHLLGESETHDSSGGHAGSPHGNVPDMPDFPDTIEWKPFGIANTTKAMSFRIEVATTQAAITNYWEFADEDDAGFLAHREMARLGRKALDLAMAFRAAWNIDPANYADDTWNVSIYLTERAALYDDRQRQREE